jgi:hypothetical protein
MKATTGHDLFGGAFELGVHVITEERQGVERDARVALHAAADDADDDLVELAPGSEEMASLEDA